MLIFAKQDEHHDPPPAYTIPAPPPAPPAKVHVHGPSPPSDNKPTNHLSLIRRDGRIRGSFVIDPRLKVPAQMLAPLETDETDETRRNLYLHSQDGSIDADVWVLSDEDADCKCRGKVRLGVSTQDGNVSLRLHSTAGSPYTPRTPLKLSLHTDDGHVSLSLPRVFRGPLTIRIGDGRMRLSRALSAATTIFSESKGISRCFVGDFAESGWADAPGEWTGDEAEVSSDDGNVRIEFDDEWAVKREMKKERRELRRERRDNNKDDDEEDEETEDGGKGKGKGKGKAKGKSFFGRLLGA
ncbi:hypothetical protein C8F01DRAFT_1006043 [Mycena amicta]|nr:hypothetical protein C8F01DRAFT_1006043 [Mycena amicta]